MYDVLINDYFRGYETGDRKLVDSLLSADFTFTSPHDDHIDKGIYFQRCWEHHKKNPRFKLERVFEKDNEAFIQYRCENNTGKIFRNTELFRFTDGKISAIEVYFGEIHFKQELF